MRPPVKKRRHVEAPIQMRIVEFLRMVLPKGSIVHGTLNEEPDAKRRQLNAAMGALPGFSDIYVLSGGVSLFLEVKTAKGSQSSAQKAFQADVESQGHVYAIVRSVDDALAVLRRVAIKTRIVSGEHIPAQRVRVETTGSGS